MPDSRVTLAQLSDLLRKRSAYQHARNLVLVALPLETAHRDARQLAQALSADSLDFDCELLAQMEADDWDEHVELERRGTLSIGQMLARDWLTKVAGHINQERPLVIGNLNLAVRYEIDVARAVYDATERGLCIVAAGGRLQGQTLLIHGRHRRAQCRIGFYSGPQGRRREIWRISTRPIAGSFFSTAMIPSSQGRCSGARPAGQPRRCAT
jgi:hypothetical protein